MALEATSLGAPPMAKHSLLHNDNFWLSSVCFDDKGGGGEDKGEGETFNKIMALSWVRLLMSKLTFLHLKRSDEDPDSKLGTDQKKIAATKHTF